MSSSRLDRTSSTALSSRSAQQIRNALSSKRVEEIAVEDHTENEHSLAVSNTNSVANLLNDDEFKLKTGPSLIIMIFQNILLQVSP